MQIKVVADKVTVRGGEYHKGDVIDVRGRAAEYLVKNGYAERYNPEALVVDEPGEVPAPQDKPKAKRGRPRKAKSDA